MNCPNCNTQMECEQAPMVRGSTWDEYRRTGRETHSVPAAHYRCEGCDSEWVWMRNEKIACVDAAQSEVLEKFRARAYTRSKE